jgi:chromosomal replication initiator protein
MITQSATDIWAQVITLVREEMDNPNYDFLLEGTHALRAEGETITVGVPTQFARDWLEARLQRELEQLIYYVASRPLKLDLVVSSGATAGRGTAGEKARKAGKAGSEQLPEQQTLSFAAPTEVRAKNHELTGGTLNSRYTFENFVVGDNNRFAYAAALAVAENPAGSYNPLFLYGGVGLGKTHLMHALGQHAMQCRKGLHVVYVTSERFTNDMVNALMYKSMAEFRNRYRQADILLIDDIQFVAGKEQTQEEIFHTFNTLYEANKQIVFSSDRPPKDISNLEDRLRSRFEWGLTADVQAPDLETRIAILRKKAMIEGYSPPDDVLSFIAKHIYSNIRELEGALIRVIAYADLRGRPVDRELAAEALKDIIPAVTTRQITISSIQEIVASHFGIKIADMRSKKRTQDIAFPRQVAMYLARELTDASLPRIGEDFGGRDHTTVMHACDKIKGQMEYDQNLAALVRNLRQRIQAP